MGLHFTAYGRILVRELLRFSGGGVAPEQVLSGSHAVELQTTRS
jgi:hypothetical protein